MLASARKWLLLAVNVLAAGGVLFGTAVHFGVAWVLPIDPVAFFAIMVGGIFLGSVASVYYVLLAFRTDRSVRGRIAWLLAFTFAAPAAAFAAWYVFVMRQPAGSPHGPERR